MAHFAEIRNNKVVRVIVIDNKNCLDENGIEKESIGILYCEKVFGRSEKGCRWIQTSYNGKIRKRFAGIGHTYDQAHDCFIPYCGNRGWTIDYDKAEFVPPIPQPTLQHRWNNETLQWESP